MRKTISMAFLLVLGGVLGATIFRTQVAGASQPPASVREVNTDAAGNIKVHEQGTASVDITNTSLPAPGGRIIPVFSNRDYSAGWLSHQRPR